MVVRSFPMGAVRLPDGGSQLPDGSALPPPDAGTSHLPYAVSSHLPDGAPFAATSSLVASLRRMKQQLGSDAPFVQIPYFRQPLYH